MSNDWAWLAEWMDGVGLGSGPIVDPTPLAGGTQNVLVRFVRSGRSYILRRPPVSKRANSDETMRRESRVLAALADTSVPHPRLIAAEPDDSKIGDAFYLMEPVNGFTASTGWPAEFASDSRLVRKVGITAIDALVALADVNPVAVGLGDFERPGDFLGRQVDRWLWHLESYSPGAGYVGLPPARIARVSDWLERYRPVGGASALLHGDYHLGNIMIEASTGSVAAIVDWELVTVGDPLLDLAHFLVCWPTDQDGGPLAEIVPVPPVAGLCNEDELVRRYLERSDRNLDTLSWYKVLAAFRLGIILEGSTVRASRGEAPPQLGERFHRVAVELLDRAHREVTAA